MTLEQAVQNALKASPDYLSAKNQMDSAKLEEKNAFAAFFPSLDLSASHGVRGIDPDTSGLTTTTNKVSGATLSLTENFYNNGESYKRNKIAEHQAELAELNLKKAKAVVVRTVLLAYYRHNIALQNLRFTQKNHSELERLSKLVSNQYHQGLKTRKDFLSFTTRSQRGRLSVLEAEKDLASARETLLSSIGLGTSSDIIFDENVKPVVPKVKLTTDFSNESLYEARALELQEKIGELQVALARRKFWPELNLVGSATYGSSDYIETNRTWSDNDSTQWSVLLNLKFNLLDWGVRSRNVQIAAAAQNTSEQAARTSLLKAEKDLELFKVDVAKTAERFKISKELQKMEEDTFKLLERDYRAGQASYLELSTGLANLLDAQARGQEADYDLAALYLSWKYYKGTLSEETFKE